MTRSIVDPVETRIASEAAGKPMRVAIYGTLMTTDIAGLSPYRPP